MNNYQLHHQNHQLRRRLLSILLVGILLFLVGAIIVRKQYYLNLRPVSSDTKSYHVVITPGSRVDQIADQLAKDHLIRSAQAFEWYIDVHNDRDTLQAGTYTIQASQSTPSIVAAISSGKVATDLITILPGQRIDQVRAVFIKSGFSATAVDAALSAAQYRSTYPALADNPASASLEGFLYPNSYQKTAATDPHQIVEEALDQMQAHLTTSIRRGFVQQGLTVYQGVTLASIVEQEVAKQSDRDQVAQVFITRLNDGISLGSDVTARYGALEAGVTNTTLTYDSPYNTLIHTGLPPGPIGTISDSSLTAVAYPANTTWLFFVAGDDGNTYYAHTLAEHNANIAKYCHTLCTQSQ
jgi:UPF0755 protein